MTDRVLVIGADGLVGRHVADALAPDAVVRTCRRGACDITLDITDDDAVRRVIRETRPAVVVLAAANAWVEGCERDPAGTRRVNVDAARVVAQAAGNTGAHLVVFSSEYVFDGSAGPYAEGDARGPLNEYGRQKVDLEDLALATGRALVCRTSAVFGEDPRRKNFAYQLVDRVRAGETFDVPADQLITPTSATSLAHAVMDLARAGATGTFHVAGPEIMSRIDFATHVAAAYGLDPSRLRPRPTHELGLAARRPPSAGLDTTKLRAALGHGLTPVADALREMASGSARTG